MEGDQPVQFDLNAPPPANMQSPMGDGTRRNRFGLTIPAGPIMPWTASPGIGSRRIPMTDESHERLWKFQTSCQSEGEFFEADHTPGLAPLDEDDGEAFRKLRN